MPKETLFNILLRQPWWVTLLVAFALFAVVRAVFPPIAPFFALPFAVLAFYIAYRQWRGTAPVDAVSRLAALREMSWEEFSAVVANAYRRDGYDVAGVKNSAYDFRLTKEGRAILLQCRRWKVNQVGVAPVRELARAVARESAYKGICIAAGEFSEPARKLTATEPISLLTGQELAQFVGSVRSVRSSSRS